MNVSELRRRIALLQRVLHRRGYVVRKSRAGVKYIVPFSRCARFIQPDQPGNDGRVYRKTERGYLVRAEAAAQ